MHKKRIETDLSEEKKRTNSQQQKNGWSFSQGFNLFYFMKLSNLWLLCF